MDQPHRQDQPGARGSRDHVLQPVPAGTHRGKAVVDGIVEAKHAGNPIEDVVWYPGYSLCKPGTTHHKLAQAGIHQTFQPVTHQRGDKPFSGNVLLIDGQLFSALLPKELRDLPVPPRGASEQEKLAYEENFNQRARWRLTRHAGPDADGATRWKCPFCSGLLRSRSFPKTMHTSRNAPLVDVDADCCCTGTLTAMPVELPLTQDIPFGTTRRISMGRRQVVESANAALKGSFTNLSRGFLRVLGLVKATVLLGFTLAAYNLDRIRSHRAKLRWMMTDRSPTRPSGPRPAAHVAAPNFRISHRPSLRSALACLRPGPARNR